MNKYDQVYNEYASSIDPNLIRAAITDTINKTQAPANAKEALNKIFKTNDATEDTNKDSNIIKDEDKKELEKALETIQKILNPSKSPSSPISTSITSQSPKM
jgi:hypothetical protein